MASPLTALVNLISSSVQTLESAYSKEGLAFPSLDEPFRPGPLDKDSAIVAATQVVVVAAHQLIATVRPPVDTVFEHGLSMYMAASLNVAVDVDVPDVLKEAGAQGLHVNEIVREGRHRGRQAGSHSTLPCHPPYLQGSRPRCIRKQSLIFDPRKASSARRVEIRAR